MIRVILLTLVLIIAISCSNGYVPYGPEDIRGVYEGVLYAEVTPYLQETIYQTIYISMIFEDTTFSLRSSSCGVSNHGINRKFGLYEKGNQLNLITLVTTLANVPNEYYIGGYHAYQTKYIRGGGDSLIFWQSKTVDKIKYKAEFRLAKEA